MSNKKNTLHVNFWAGPGTGKSTTAAGVFSILKQNDLDSELISEYAKQLVWEESFPKMANQIYIFGKQHKRHEILDGKVEIVVTDSPFPMGLLYDEGRTKYLKELCMSEFNKMWNVNIFLHREKQYNPNGRMQTYDEAVKKDLDIKNFMIDNNIPFIEYKSNTENIGRISEDIIKIYKDATLPF